MFTSKNLSLLDEAERRGVSCIGLVRVGDKASERVDRALDSSASAVQDEAVDHRGTIIVAVGVEDRHTLPIGGEVVIL